MADSFEGTAVTKQPQKWWRTLARRGCFLHDYHLCLTRRSWHSDAVSSVTSPSPVGYRTFSSRVLSTGRRTLEIQLQLGPATISACVPLMGESQSIVMSGSYF